MPSRITIVGIILFWLVTLMYVGYREVWPRYFDDAPPVVQIDLVDEATPSIPIKWKIYRGGSQPNAKEDKVGEMSSRMEHVAEDDTFRYINTYRYLSFQFAAGVSIEVPVAETTIRMTRDGELREQTTSGKMEGKLLNATMLSASASVAGRVENNQLLGEAELKFQGKTIQRPLEPVEVPRGQVLNPLMPLNRLQGVTPGRRWVIRTIDPLSESLQLLIQEMTKDFNTSLLPSQSRNDREFMAEVLRTPETLLLNQKESVCWVIRYESTDKRVQARTWVRQSDGRVMQQEAEAFGEKLRFERQE